MTAASFGQGNETFDNFSETGSSYADGTFLGQDGSTWTYFQSRGDQSITGKSLMLGRNRTPQAEVSSGTITGGIGVIQFDYQRAFSTNVDLQILINDVVFATVTSTDANVQSSGEITVNQPGDATIKFISTTNGGGQVVIDNVVWTGFTGMATPTISITSPSDMTVFDAGTSSVDLEWAVLNGNGTESVSVTVNGVTTTNASSPFPIATVDGETYNAEVQLIDGGLLDSDSVSFSVAFPCTLNIENTTATCDAINAGTGDTYTVEFDYTGGGNSTYTIDTGGVGTVGGDNPTTVPAGTITVSGVPENDTLVVNFLGDSANSGCDFTRFVTSPVCDPQQELPFTNNFEYGTTAGDLTTVSSGEWEAHSGAGNGPVQYSQSSLVLDGYDARASFGGSVVLSPSNSEDVNFTFTEQTTDKVYMSALVNVSAVNGNNYFWHFNASGFRARVGAQSDGATGINFGIGASSTPTYGSTSYDLNTTYLLVASFDTATGQADLHVLTAPTGTEPMTPETSNTGSAGSISAVSFRQSSGIANVTIDGLRVAKTWANLALSNNDFETREFAIFPNPTNTGEVTISSVNAAPMAVTVFDMLGKQVKNETISNNRLNVSNLKAGIYLLNITQDGASSTKKLVIK